MIVVRVPDGLYVIGFELLNKDQVLTTGLWKL